MPGPVQVVYDNRPRMSDAIGNLYQTLRGNQQRDDAAKQQQATGKQQQAHAVMQYLVSKKASPQQWEQVRQNIAASDPEIASYIPSLGAVDESGQERLDAITTQLSQDAAARIQSGKGSQMDHMIVFNQKAIGTEGGLKNTMYDRLGSAPRPSTLSGNGRSRLGAIISGEDDGAMDVGPTEEPPQPTMQDRAASNAFGITPTAYESGRMGETRRHNVAGEGETERYHAGRLGFESQRTGAYVGAKGAQTRASNAIADVREQQTDPNSGWTETQTKIRQGSGRGAKDMVQQQIEDYNKNLRKLSAQEQTLITQYNEAVAAKDEKKKTKAWAGVTSVRGTMKGLMQSRAALIQQGGGRVGGNQHFVMGPDGKMAPISAPPPPDENEDDNQPDDEGNE